MPWKSEAYTLHPMVKAKCLEALGVDPRDIKIDLFANHKNHTRELYCRKETSAFLFDWSKLDSLLWANPPWTQLLKVIVKCCLNPCKLILTHPKWEDQSWYQLLKKVAVQTVEVPPGTEVYYTDRKNCSLHPSGRRQFPKLTQPKRRCFYMS
eukprot:TRINITY_DN1049_c0_g3_i2.p3 TRINITY_DN1049_c0_g3~~TRINITY_DN1049_c0_g3_i2.p3  ORF type:complete len:152 (+),score=3.51 TRINITY_DN1049_c0_g3_i2:2268-2723(+)